MICLGSKSSLVSVFSFFFGMSGAGGVKLWSSRTLLSVSSLMREIHLQGREAVHNRVNQQSNDTRGQQLTWINHIDLVFASFYCAMRHTQTHTHLTPCSFSSRLFSGKIGFMSHIWAFLRWRTRRSKQSKSCTDQKKKIVQKHENYQIGRRVIIL